MTKPILVFCTVPDSGIADRRSEAFDSEKTCRLRQLGGANTIGLPVAGECREGSGMESDDQDGQWKV